MKYTHTQIQRMSELKQLLEKRGIETNRHFADAFKCLRDVRALDLRPLVARIGFTVWTTNFWAEEELLPPRDKWPEITKATLRLLETELQKEDA